MKTTLRAELFSLALLGAKTHPRASQALRELGAKCLSDPKPGEPEEFIEWCSWYRRLHEGCDVRGSYEAWKKRLKE